MCPIGHKCIYCIIALRRICVALYRRYGEVHRLVVDGMRIVVELVADEDDLSSCIKIVVVVVVVRDVVVNEVRRDVARDVVHFGGEVGHPWRRTCRRTRRRSVPCRKEDEGQGGRRHVQKPCQCQRMRLRINPTKRRKPTN